MKTKHTCLALVIFFIITACGIMPSAASIKNGYVDTHMHLNGSYRASRGAIRTDYKAAAKNLIARMDRLGIKKTIIMPPPQKSTRQKGAYSYLALLETVREYPDRLFLAAGGGTLNPMIHGSTDEETVNEKTKADFRREAEEMIRAGAKGFGETTALHLSFNDNHVFEEVQPDHPLFLLLSDIAAENNVPIDFHMEAVSYDTGLPRKFSVISKNNPPAVKENIQAFERLLDHKKNARIVWQHIGWDNTGHMTVDLLRRLLTSHTNLYLSMRIVTIPENIPDPLISQNRIVDKNWKIKPEWFKLMRDFPDRFMVGGDEFIGVSGQKRHKSQSFEETWTVIDNQLPPDLAQKIGRENAARVYNLK